jgi:hypothetical protein
MAPQLDEHILYNVLRGRMVPEDAQRATVDRRCQAVEHLRQGNVVSGGQSRS